MNHRHMDSLPKQSALQAGAEGHLIYSGCDMVALARTVGTPLYVMDEDGIRSRCRLLKDRFTDRYPDTGVLYASKAFSTLAMGQIIREEGLGIDVVSGGELHTALQAGISPERIYFHGNNKSAAELLQALQAGVGRYVADSLQELALLDRLARRVGKVAGVLLRVSPGIDAHTHAYLQTGVLDCKFGFPAGSGDALEAARAVKQYEGLRFEGLHCHIGSQIFAQEPYLEAAAVMTALAHDITSRLELPVRELNLGGGFGIRYTAADSPFDLGDLLDRLMAVVESACRGYGIPRPRVLIEPGRWLVGENGITLYAVGGSKVIPEVRTYLSIDGGMADNPRPALYQAQYQAVLANRLQEPETQTVTVAGKCCESGDLLIREAPLPAAEPGDILAVLSTGAYTYSMSSNYNRLPRPPVYLVRGGVPHRIVRGEDYGDVTRNDEWLPDTAAGSRAL